MLENLHQVIELRILATVALPHAVLEGKLHPSLWLGKKRWSRIIIRASTSENFKDI